MALVPPEGCAVTRRFAGAGCSQAIRDVHRIGEQLAPRVDNLGGRPPDRWGSMTQFPVHASTRRDAPIDSR
jgi:hypothetical protein